MTLDGGVNTLAYETYVESLLASSLRPDQMVVMDNLFVHKGARVRQLIEDRGCQLLFLPAYSPDFSPIEEAFSRTKTFLRRTGTRAREILQESIAQALLTVTPQEARG